MCPLFQRHWDRLPLELQQYIIRLATWQHVRDRRRNIPLRKLLEEINDYGDVKQTWTIGPVKIILKKCDHTTHSAMYNSLYNSHYNEIRGRLLKTFINGRAYQTLGFSLKFAKINAFSLQKYHLRLIEEHPEWFLD